MQQIISQSRSIKYISIMDIMIIIAVLIVPAVSHIMPIPMYYLDPMRLLVFVGYLLGRNNANAILLAIVLPLFSSLVTGHPILLKASLISCELLVNIWLLQILYQRSQWHISLQVFVSIIASKITYYIVKQIFLNFEWLNGPLITTSLWIQGSTVAFLVLLFAIVYKSVYKKN
jgi:hypothetical protein